MMTATELGRWVGMTGRYNFGGEFVVDVTVLNVRERFGDVDYHIAPVSGTGSKWVAAHKVIFSPEGGK